MASDTTSGSFNKILVVCGMFAVIGGMFSKAFIPAAGSAECKGADGILNLWKIILRSKAGIRLDDIIAVPCDIAPQRQVI